MPTNTSTAVAVQQPPAHPIVAALDERMPALADMLPGGEDAAKRFKRVVIQAVVRNPDLMKCTPASIVSAVMESATIGIEPTGTLGGAYLVPYGNKATLIVGYRGLIELARRSGEIESIEARVVREGDEFSYEYGTSAHVRHVPKLEAGDRALTFVYGVAKLRGGTTQFEVMTREQVEAIRSRSKSGNSGPWKTDYDEMARKTVVRRLVKYLPIAVEARDLIERDDADFEPGAIVARVASKTEDLRDKLAERTAALRGEVVVSQPVVEAPPEPEPEPEPEPDPEEEASALPFEAQAGDASDAGTDAGVAPAECQHPAAAREVRPAGIVCTECGLVLASYSAASPKPARARAAAKPEPVPRAKANRDAMMARLHVNRSHDQVKAIAAAVLGIDPESEWSLADLVDDELQAVIQAVRDEDQRRSDRASRPARQPVAAGRRR
jgi:recombination protein RecT